MICSYFSSPFSKERQINQKVRYSIEKDVLAILGSGYSSSDVTYYISSNYTTADYLPQFVKQSELFQAGLPNCNIA